MALKVGAKLGPYEILSPAGAGGMGEVYRARDTRLDRTVAIKVLPEQFSQNPDLKQRFEREARAISQLNHPNICTLYDVGHQDGTDYLVLEYIEGESLSSRLMRGPLPVEQTLKTGTEIAGALEKAHRQGIIHRDLKPGNVMLTTSGAKLLDFGLAKIVREPGPMALTESLSRTEGALGTPPYMAPEQLLGEKVDARADIWAVGAVLYEMATGRRAFPGSGPRLADAILHQPPVPPSGANRKVSLALEAIILKALDKDPDRRYQSARELAVDLERLSSGSTPRTEATQRRTVAVVLPRRRWQSLVLALGALAFVLGGVWLANRRAGTRSSEKHPVASAEPVQIQQLTNFVGLAWGETLSPDAAFVAYAHNRYGQMDLFVLPTTGGNPVRLTDTPADEVGARWSPDGRYIAFLSDRGSGTNVYLIPPLGGLERKVAETGLPWIGRGIEAIHSLGAQPWSPDASELIFSRLQPTGAVALWKINLDTGEQTQLTRPAPGVIQTGASWSFGGKRIAFTQQEGGRTSLWLMDAQGGQPAELLGDQFLVQGPAWLTDNQRLVYVSNRGGPANLWEIDSRNGQLRPVTSGTGNTLMPTVSANGKIAYSQYTHQVDVYWAEIGQPEEHHQRLTAHTRNNFGARVAPDGEHILYQSDQSGNYDLWLLDRRTGAERQLTDDPGPDFMGDWSPDGRQIVFLSGRGGSLQPWVLDVDSGKVRRISERSHAVSFEPHFSGPRWSPDGKAIAFVASGDKQDTLFIVDPQGGNERSVLPGLVGFDWYRDSRHVLYTREATDGSGIMEMRVIDLQTGKEEVLLRGPTAEMVVSRGGRAVAYLHALSHFAMQLVVQRLIPPGSRDGLPRPLGKPEQITHGGGNWHVHNGGWSPDGKAIVYTRDADSGSVYMITNYY